MVSHFGRFSSAVDNPDHCPSNLAAFRVHPRPFAADSCARRVLEARKKRDLVRVDFGVVPRLDARGGMVGFRFVKGVCGCLRQLDEKSMVVAECSSSGVLRGHKHYHRRNPFVALARPFGTESFAPCASLNSREF